MKLKKTIESIAHLGQDPATSIREAWRAVQEQVRPDASIPTEVLLMNRVIGDVVDYVESLAKRKAAPN